MSHEVVLHGDPMLVVRTGGQGTRGPPRGTVHGRGKLAEDLLTALARHHLDVRDQVVSLRGLQPTRAGRAHRLVHRRAVARTSHGARDRVVRTPVPERVRRGSLTPPVPAFRTSGLSAALVAQGRRPGSVRTSTRPLR